MEHAEALERIEIAAVEPEGLDRLMAGDTPDAAAVAGHLAGCPSCADELVRIRRSSTVARAVVQAEPDPELRERTLAFVKAVGRDRSTGVGVPVPTGAAAISVVPAGALPAQVVPARRADRRGWAVLGIAAALVIAVGAGYLAGGSAERANTAASEKEVAILSDAAVTAVQIQSQPDAQRVVVDGPAGIRAGAQFWPYREGSARAASQRSRMKIFQPVPTRNVTLPLAT